MDPHTGIEEVVRMGTSLGSSIILKCGYGDNFVDL